MWNSVLNDYQETYDLYINEPQVMEENVKSYNASETFEYLVDPEDTFLRAQWIDSEFAVEIKMKTRLIAEKLKTTISRSTD